MFDISKTPPIALLIVLGVILLLYVIAGARAGLKKKLFDLVLLVLLGVGLIYGVPKLAPSLAQGQYLRAEINGLIAQLPENLQGFVGTVSDTALYTTLAVAVILFLYIFIKFMYWLISKFIFKHKSATDRIFGGLFNGLIGAIVCLLIMIGLGSETLFGESGRTLMYNTPVVSEVYKNVESIQGDLIEKGIPCDIESLCAKILVGKDSTPEDLNRYSSAIKRFPTLVEDLQNGNAEEKFTNEDGSLNNDKVVETLDDAIVVMELVNKMPESKKAEIKTQVEANIGNVKGQLFDKNGEPIQTVYTTEEQKNSLIEAATEFGLDEATINQFSKLLVTEAAN